MGSHEPRRRQTLAMSVWRVRFSSGPPFMKKKDVTYKQCVMEKPTEKGFMRHVAWIPKQFAVIGKILRIDGFGDGWKVCSNGTAEISFDEANSRSQLHKKTRKASDV